MHFIDHQRKQQKGKFIITDALGLMIIGTSMAVYVAIVLYARIISMKEFGKK